MKSFVAWLAVAGVSFVSACAPAEKPAMPAMNASKSTRYEDLTTLFGEWRDFQKPKLVDGVPDYGASAMEAQQKDLASYQGRLAAIDPSGWPIAQQVDYHVVRAEMNGLDFDHRVLRPWANNPAFYVTVFASESDQPAREGPLAYGSVELWKYDFPLSPGDAARIAPGIGAVAGLVRQAQKNLVGNGKDLWVYGAKSIREQGRVLEGLLSRLTEAQGDLRASVQEAKQTTDAFATWLEEKAPEKTGPSGIGVENYDWYLKNVQLVPYTWHDEVLIMERELARAGAFLALEEKRNEGLPQPKPIASASEHDRRFDEAVTEYMAFLRDHDILTVKDYMDPELRAQVGKFDPGPREFFTEVDYRDPEVMRTHGYHWFDKGWMAHEGHKSPVRQVALLYNIFNTRTEGHATGWEEMMLQAGMFDRRPRSRELIYILLAERAARALGDLRMHSNEFTLEQAAEFASANTPRGWLSLSGNLVRGEQHLYLQQPAYGTSYVIGKIEVEKLLAERKRQLGDQFDLKELMDAFNVAGLVPASLLRWELTGEMPDDVRRMLSPSPDSSASQGPH
jgi:Bacterial protein of unknown function (DUF885)